MNYSMKLMKNFELISNIIYHEKSQRYRSISLNKSIYKRYRKIQLTIKYKDFASDPNIYIQFFWKKKIYLV